MNNIAEDAFSVRKLLSVTRPSESENRKEEMPGLPGGKVRNIGQVCSAPHTRSERGGYIFAR